MKMSYHRTASGAIESVDAWGHGRTASGDWYSAPATIVVDDGYGHYTAWRYTGQKHDAIVTAAGFVSADDRLVIVAEGNSVFPVRRPDWAEGVEEIVTDADGEPMEYRYHPERQPGGVCMA